MSCMYCGGENCGSSAGGPEMCENRSTRDVKTDVGSVLLRPQRIGSRREITSRDLSSKKTGVEGRL